MSAWVNFASNGDPNGDGLPEWDIYTPDSAPISISAIPSMQAST